MGLRITPSSNELYNCNELSSAGLLSYHCTSPSGKYGHADQTEISRRIDFYGADGALEAYSVSALFVAEQNVFDASDTLIGTIRNTNNMVTKMFQGDAYDFFDHTKKKIASARSDFWLHHYTFYNPHTEQIIATSEVPWFFSNTYTIKILRPDTIDPSMIVFMHIKNSIIRADDDR